MTKGINRVTYSIGIIGSTIGLALVTVSLGAYLVGMAYSGAAFFLIFTIIGAVILFAGLICIVSAKQTKNRPWLGVGVLLISAVAGCLLGFPVIIWGIMGLVGVVNALDT